MLTLRARQVLHPAHISLCASQAGSAAKGEKTGETNQIVTERPWGASELVHFGWSLIGGPDLDAS
jgi:hypothetical protein